MGSREGKKGGCRLLGRSLHLDKNKKHKTKNTKYINPVQSVYIFYCRNYIGFPVGLEIPVMPQL